MDSDALERLLSELRAVGTDHSSVEAKRAEQRLPSTLWETLSSFANTDGGTILLGVDEAGGAFEVIGVADPASITSDLQSVCAELEPPLRPLISVVAHGEQMVVTAELAPLPLSARPCHRRAQGPLGTSFIRVGDADQTLTQAEIDEMRANQSGHDHSRRPAPEGASLDDSAVAAFVERVRAGSTNPPTDDDELFRRWGVIGEDGQPTVAGALALGRQPIPLAAGRVAYRRAPREGDPTGTRHAGSHPEGPIGTLLDDLVARLGADLGTVQVNRSGHVVDDADIPLLALREILSNALLHRSLSSVQETATSSVEISDDAVVITSPGGLHVGADPALLGLDSISGVRNLTLVRICEQLQTPGGFRIIENQASGIATADRECRALGTMPALFIDLPARFQVILLRGALDTASASGLLRAKGLPEDSEYVRLVAVAMRLQKAVEEAPLSGMARISLDARLAARALGSTTVEDAAALLRKLEDAGVLERRHTRHGSSWRARLEGTTEATPAQRTHTATPRRRDQPDRIMELLRAIDRSQDGELSSSALGEELGLASSNSINRWITRAGEAGLIEATAVNPYDPRRAYRLTPAGEGVLRREQRP